MSNCSTELNPASQTFELIEQINQVNAQIERFKKRHARLKKKLAKHIRSHLKTLSREEAGNWLGGIYWEDQALEYFLQMACTSVFGARFKPDPQQIEMPCTKCGNKIIDLCVSWMSFRCLVKKNLCKVCRKEIQKDKREKSILRKQEQGTSYEQIEQEEEEELQHLKTMDYDEYLKTEHWQEVRKDALRRAKYRCQLCNAQAKMHVHHRTYERRGEEIPSDVIALCVPCHEKHHDIPPKSYPNGKE